MRMPGGKFFVLYAVLCCAGCSVLRAQDTVAIEAVSINARKAGFASTGRKVESVDSAFRDLFRFGTVSELLAFHSVAQLRTYGGGGISMAGLRGASVEQTAVLWNGMNLQNSMLGLTDLSLAPAVLFESAAVEYGSAASTWGSGAVGGSIHLDNRAAFGKKFNVSAGVSAGDIGQLSSSAVIHTGGPRLVNVSKLYMTRSANSYRYYHEGNDRFATMQHAAFGGRGWMNELRALVGKHHMFSLNAWLSEARRQIPGYDPSLHSSQHQRDGAARFQAAWVFLRNRSRAQLRTAYFNEYVGYTDSLVGIRNLNSVATFMTDVEQFLRWNDANELHTGLSFLRTTGMTENYDGPGELRRFSFIAGNRTSFPAKKLFAIINGRMEYFSHAALPVTGNAALEYVPFSWLTAGAGLSTAYRQPTLNEIYWVPGGNRDLRPERSRSADGHIKLSHRAENLKVSVTFAAFTRKVADWILWTPGPSGQPSPYNLREVWSRGAETTWEGSVQRRRRSFGLRLATSYVLSTVVSSYNRNDGSEGRQLVYTPRYTAAAHLYGGFRNTRIYLMSQYAGYRFTTSDNTAWLNPYTLLSVRLTQHGEVAGMPFDFYAACNNLLNAHYVVMAGRWMPLRHFEFGLTIHINKKQKE